jgi:hypothetical protein
LTFDIVTSNSESRTAFAQSFGEDTASFHARFESFTSSYLR